LLGARWAGATYVPIGWKQPEERILALLAQCGLSVIVIDDDGAKLLSKRLFAACPPLVIHAGQNRITSAHSLFSVIATVAAGITVILVWDAAGAPSSSSCSSFCSASTAGAGRALPRHLPLPPRSCSANRNSASSGRASA
jgi:acyl-CoA synthetase (AMP-forming)/AMP-acid ligase II